MNILAIGAHPDDIEYGCGGTLLLQSRAGNNIYLLILTEGESSGEGKVRRKEQKESARILGVKEIFWGGFMDTEIPVNKKAITKIEEVIAKVKPDEIYLNYFDDTHQDHRTLSLCGLAATRYIKCVFLYESYTTSNFEPNIFVDIEPVLEDKVKLLKAHSSQVNRIYPTNLDMIESIEATANFRGFQGKVKYAEGFKALRVLRKI